MTNEARQLETRELLKANDVGCIASLASTRVIFNIWSWDLILTVVWKENTIYTLPFLFFRLVGLALLLALKSSLLVFVETLKAQLLTYITTSYVALMLPEFNIVYEGGAATMTLGRQKMAAI